MKAYQFRLYVDRKLKGFLGRMARECYTKPEVRSDLYNACLQMVKEKGGEYSPYIEDTLSMLIVGDIRYASCMHYFMFAFIYDLFDT